MPFCLKYEIAFGSDRKAKHIFVLAADAIRKVAEQTVGKHAFLSLARGHFRIVERHTMHDNSWEFMEMSQSFSRNSKTHKSFSTPRARPEQVRLGPQIGLLFRRPIQRAVRFGWILQRKHQTTQPL